MDSWECLQKRHSDNPSRSLLPNKSNNRTELSSSTIKSNMAPSTSNMEPSIWTCPHKALLYECARTLLLYCPPDVGSDYVEALPECWQCGDNLLTSVEHLLQPEHSLSLRTEIKLFSARDYANIAAATRCFSMDRIALALSALDLPMCIHKSTNDPAIWNFAPHFCYMLQVLNKPPEICICRPGKNSSRPHGAHFGRCADCEEAGTCTQYGFVARETVSNKRRTLGLYLVIFRDLGALQRRHKYDEDTAWKLHTPSLNTVINKYVLSCIWKYWLKYISKHEEKWGANCKFSDKDSFGHRSNLARAFSTWRCNKDKRRRQIEDFARGKERYGFL
jgi:hypothetical protein